MSTATIQSIWTDPTYAAQEAFRTREAYRTARDVQDITHELRVCTKNGVSGVPCQRCTGCTFGTFYTMSPKSAVSIVNWVISNLHAENPVYWTMWFETDLTGLGGHVAHVAENATFNAYWDEMGEILDKAIRSDKDRYLDDTPDVDICIKLRNTIIWEFFARMCANGEI